MTVHELVADAIGGFNRFVLVYFCVLNAVYVLLFLVSLYEVLHFLRRTFFSDYRQLLASDMTLPISILVPARNEEKTIVDTVRSLLMLNYPEFEIIVINDGSTDDTLAQLVRAFELRRLDRAYRRSLATAPVRAVYSSPLLPNLAIIDKERGGKADALNAGINLSRYPLFCSVDADSVMEEDALLKAVKPFMDHPDETVAVGGIVRCVNGCTVSDGRVTGIALPNRALPILQVVEYLRAFLSGRLGWSALRSLLIISGAFGLYRKSAVIEVGGYSHETDTEDLELVLALHHARRRQGRRYRVVFVPDPVCWTEVPNTLQVLQRQRTRWHRGMLQSFTRHRGMLFNPRFGVVGLLGFPYFMLFEMLGPFIEVLGYVAILVSWALGILDLEFALLFFALAVLFGVFLSIAAVLLEEISFRRYPAWEDLLKLVVFGVLENFGYRQLLAVFKLRAFWDFLGGRRRWGRMDRQGFQRGVAPPPRPAAVRAS